MNKVDGKKHLVFDLQFGLPKSSPLPAPLPVPRYQDDFTPDEMTALRDKLPDALTDEILLIRSRLSRINRLTGDPSLPLPRLISAVDLLSCSAARLARLLYHRQRYHKQRLASPAYLADRAATSRLARQELIRQADIRSSKNSDLDLIIKTPLLLSPVMRDTLKPVLYPHAELPSAPGRPPADLYAVLEGILQKLLTGIPWNHLPLNYPPAPTCHRYFQHWVRNGKLEYILRLLTLICLTEQMAKNQLEDEDYWKMNPYYILVMALERMRQKSKEKGLPPFP